MAERIDHDALFKLLLTNFFREFLDLFAPDLAAALDPEPLLFLDKESFSDLLDPDRREADLVIQARMRSQAATLLIHLEHQAQADATLDRRLFRYFARLYDRYDAPVYPIALCSYPRPRQPVADRHRLIVSDRTILDFQFQVVQLNRLDWRDFLQTRNPVAMALMARMHIAPPIGGESKQRACACWPESASAQRNGDDSASLSISTCRYALLKNRHCTPNWRHLPTRNRRLSWKCSRVGRKKAGRKGCKKAGRKVAPKGCGKAGRKVALKGCGKAGRKGCGKGNRCCSNGNSPASSGPLPDGVRTRLERLPLPQLTALGEAMFDIDTLGRTRCLAGRRRYARHRYRSVDTTRDIA
jgi:hypothetical protein